MSVGVDYFYEDYGPGIFFLSYIFVPCLVNDSRDLIEELPPIESNVICFAVLPAKGN
jgi:hypothetical protein